jgi:hypothetical protein
VTTDPEFPQRLPARRRASPVPPIEQDIEPAGLDGVASERVVLARDELRHKAQVGRDRLMTGLVAAVLALGGAAVFTDRLEAETLVVGFGSGLLGYFVRGETKQ